jgi:hypothetical protein
LISSLFAVTALKLDQFFWKPAILGLLTYLGNAKWFALRIGFSSSNFEDWQRFSAEFAGFGPMSSALRRFLVVAYACGWRMSKSEHTVRV